MFHFCKVRYTVTGDENWLLKVRPIYFADILAYFMKKASDKKSRFPLNLTLWHDIDVITYGKYFNLFCNTLVDAAAEGYLMNAYCSFLPINKVNFLEIVEEAEFPSIEDGFSQNERSK